MIIAIILLAFFEVFDINEYIRKQVFSLENRK